MLLISSILIPIVKHKQQLHNGYLFQKTDYTLDDLFTKINKL